MDLQLNARLVGRFLEHWEKFREISDAKGNHHRGYFRRPPQQFEANDERRERRKGWDNFIAGETARAGESPARMPALGRHGYAPFAPSFRLNRIRMCVLVVENSKSR